MKNNNYPVKGFHIDLDFYKDTDKTWKKCPYCGLRPKIWVFDNGRSTSCGCWKSDYDHFSIHAESIMSVQKRTGKTKEYDSNGLQHNWNHWCVTKEVLFEHASLRTDERW